LTEGDQSRPSSTVRASTDALTSQSTRSLDQQTDNKRQDPRSFISMGQKSSVSNIF